MFLFTFPCKLYKKIYKGGLRVKMTREANRVEIKVTELFTHHRMLQCFRCVSDQSVAEVNKTNQVVLSWIAVPLISLRSINSKHEQDSRRHKQDKIGGILADGRALFCVFQGVIKVLQVTGTQILSVLAP